MPSFPLVLSQKCKKEMMVCDLHVKLVLGQRLGPQPAAGGLSVDKKARPLPL